MRKIKVNLVNFQRVNHSKLCGSYKSSNGCKFYSTHLYRLPFNIKENEASEHFFKNQSFWEKDLFGHFDSKELSLQRTDILKSYLPFYTVSISNLYSTFRAEYGIDKTRLVPDFSSGKFRLRHETYTVWYETSGTTGSTNYPLGIEATQIYAGFNHPRNQIESSLADSNLNELILMKNSDITEKYEPHVMKMAYALELIYNRIYDMETSRIKNSISNKYNADHVNIRYVDVGLEKSELKLFSYFIPTYILCSGDNSSFHKYLNAHGGNCGGKTLYSWDKVLFIASTLGALGATLVGGPVARISIFLTRAMVGALITGIPAGLWTRIYPSIKNYMDARKKDKEFDYNENIHESESDRVRRKFIEGDYSFTSSKKKLSFNKCKLLGLNPHSNITIDDIKKAYHEQILKWHPDIYIGDKQIALNMAQQINEAYKTIISEIQNN